MKRDSARPLHLDVGELTNQLMGVAVAQYTGSARTLFVSLAVLGFAGGCSSAQQEEESDTIVGEETSIEDGTMRIVGREVARIDSAAAAMDSVFQPLPLMTPAEESALRTYLNDQQLGRARALGVGRNLSADRLQALREDGTLTVLEDTDYWVVRDLDYSAPLAVPGVHELLTEIGERFHARLAELGAPPLRMEITSVLRRAEDQQALRQVNPNAATGESTHEYGTTVDVLYSAFSAPAGPLVEIPSDLPPDASSVLRRYSDTAAERVAGRRALELKNILGEVLLEVQGEGRVMVTLERQQPVFHMTLAR